MNGEELRVELLKRDGVHKGGHYELAAPANVTAKHIIHNKVFTKKLTISQVWPRAYTEVDGQCRAFWPLFDCEIS